MKVYRLNPCRDLRWAALVDRHPDASIFHTTGWLESLHRTYGYDPVAFTTSPPGSALANGIVLCDVKSCLTGQRLVSLPFSDHCEPMVQSNDQLEAIGQHVK